ncbi:MAG TPA: universal stress protein [Thermoleophilaceae bacterium]|jgi:nucleotide-binding universal stress UspA family protein|nr:universal stress protein [Thermoleophilaceae bacterium]
MAESGSIVVGFDGGECAGRALDTAVDLAKRFGDRVVIVFGAGPPGTPTEEFREHRRAIEEIGERVTTEAAERVRDGDVEVEVVVAPDRPSVALSKAAEERDARFIVVGSYGESPIKGAIVGSVPHKLLQISETPVVVVRA